MAEIWSMGEKEFQSLEKRLAHVEAMLEELLKKPEQPEAGAPILPATGLLRLRQVLQFYPVSRTTWWRGMREGRFPKPVRIGPASVAWRVEDIRRLVNKGK